MKIQFIIIAIFDLFSSKIAQIQPIKDKLPFTSKVLNMHTNISSFLYFSSTITIIVTTTYNLAGSA